MLAKLLRLLSVRRKPLHDGAYDDANGDWPNVPNAFLRPTSGPFKTRTAGTPSVAPRAGAVRGSRGLSVRTSHANRNATETD